MSPRARTLHRAHLTFAFSLVSAALARIVMQVLGTRLLDPGVAQVGVVLAAVVGALTSIALQALRDREGWRLRAWALVPIAGALVGMAMQALLLLNKPDYRLYVISEGVSSRHPAMWILIGAPFGALPALVAGALLRGALQIGARVAPQDARERMLVPLAGGCALLHAVTLSSAEGGDLVVVLFVLALAVLALAEVFFADTKRIAFVHRIFAGDDPVLAIEHTTQQPLPSDVPLVVGGIHPALLIVGDAGERGYRAAARAPFAAVAESMEATVAPLLRRRGLLAALAAGTLVTSAIALATR